MAWSVVQSKPATTAAASTLSITLNTTPTTGNKIIIAADISTSVSTPTLKDNNGAGASLTLLASAVNGTNNQVYLFAYDVPATPQTVFQIAVASGNPAMVLLAQEVSGLVTGNTTAMIDGTAGTVTGSIPSTGGNSTSPTYSSTAASEYLVSAHGDWGEAVTWTAPSGYTLDTNSTNGSATADLLVGYKNSANGSESAVWAGGSGSATDQYASVLVAFKVTAAAAPDLNIYRIN